MAFFEGGRYQVALDRRTGGAFFAALVNGEIHGRGSGCFPGGWVFKGIDGPLLVEDHPFAMVLGSGAASFPDALLVRIQGEDGLTLWASSDDCQTWLPMAEYMAKAKAAGVIK